MVGEYVLPGDGQFVTPRVTFWLFYWNWGRGKTSKLLKNWGE